MSQGMLPEVSSTATHESGSFLHSNMHQLPRLKALVETADSEALQNGGQISESLIAELRTTFSSLCLEMNTLLGEQSTLPAEARQSLGRQFRREVLPYLLLASTAERWYAKPRGYAGDFLTIEQLYQDQARGTGRIGALLDRCFLDLPAAHAVRNRRQLLVEEIRATVAQVEEGQIARITSLASGPAREIFDVFEQLENPDKLLVTLVDFDLQALAFVSDKVRTQRWRKRLHFVPGNLIYVVNGKQNLSIESQDLIYSIGLIDYFADKFVVRLLDYIHSKLRPGGRVLLGNFHPRNPTRALMEHVMNWKLIHRTEEEMHRLFRRSAFRRSCSRIRFEAQRINLFAECIKGH